MTFQNAQQNSNTAESIAATQQHSSKILRGVVIDSREACVFAAAWLRVTDDPIVGTDQDSTTF